jgi:hypothetical protein
MGLSKSSPYATTISTFFIQVSLFDEAGAFFRPDAPVLNAGARRACQGRPWLCPCLALRRFQAAS